MAKYLLDTNVVLRLVNSSDTKHNIVVEAIYKLLLQGNECYLAPQIIIELWVVATRPKDVNGLGWNTEKTRNIIDQLLMRFPIIEESPQIFSTWLTLVTNNQILGKKSHDIRLVSTMLANNIDRLLTFNPKDFKKIQKIIVIKPQEILKEDN